MIASTASPAAALPQTSRADAQDHSTAEYAALLSQVRAFTAEDWGAQTDCTEWTVGEMVAHLAGASEDAVRMGLNLRHMARAVRRLGKASDRDLAGHLCDQQIARRTSMSTADLVADLERWAARAPRARRRQPAPMRAVKLPAFAGLRPGARLSYLLDVIYTRDLWMHRIDLARATGQAMSASSAEGEVVAQVVRDLDAEWSGPAFELVVTGRVEGAWAVGAGDPVATVTEDAVSVMRLLSGRSDECALATVGDVSVTPLVRAARVVF